MFAQKDAGGSTRVASEKQGQEAWIFEPGLPAGVRRPSPAVVSGRIRRSSYWMVAVASPLLLNRLKMVLNSCLP
jgi:hypothetical protein